LKFEVSLELPASRFMGRCQVEVRPAAIAENFLARLSGYFPAKFPIAMKAKIIITPKKAVLDPQGKTVQNALAHMGYTGVTGVHIGKYIEIDLAPGTDKAAAEKAINDAAHKLLSNPVIEDYKLEIE
jgi:phosphoribosylformylglycinamidine synthase